MAIGSEVNVALAFTVASNTAKRELDALGKAFTDLTKGAASFKEASDRASASLQQLAFNGRTAFTAISAGATAAAAAIGQMAQANALNQLNTATNGIAAGFTRLRAAAGGINWGGGFNLLSQGAGRAQQAIQNLDLSFRELDRTMKYLIAFAITGAGAALVKTAAQLERTSLEIGVFNGSFESASKTLDKVLAVTNQVPFSVKSMTDAFVKLKASGIDPITGANGEGPLLTLANAVAAFGGTTDVFERAILAVSQMAGKGVISMEELRQQLGEALPTAIRSMAAGLDMSITEFIDQVGRGKIEFQRGFGALISELNKQFGGVGNLMLTTLSGAFQALKTQMDTFILSLQRAGLFDPFIAGMTLLKNKMKEFTDYLNTSDGQQWLKKFQDNIYSTFSFIERSIPALARFGDALLNIGKIVGNFLSLLSPEQAAYGVVGWLIFGPRGGAIFALLGNQLDGIVTALGRVSQGVANVLDISKSKGDALLSIAGSAAAYGYLGYILLGPEGALLAALGSVAFKVGGIIGDAMNAKYGITNNESNAGKSDFGGSSDAIKSANAAIKEYNSSITQAGASTVTVSKSISTLGTTAKKASVDLGATGDTLATNTAAAKALADGLDATRKKMIESAGAVENKFSLSINSVKGVQKATEALEAAEIKAGAAGDNFEAGIERQRKAFKPFGDAIEEVKDKLFALQVERQGLEKRLETFVSSDDVIETQRRLAQVISDIKGAKKEIASLNEKQQRGDMAITQQEVTEQQKRAERAAVSREDYVRKELEAQKTVEEAKARSGDQAAKVRIAAIDAEMQKEEQLSTLRKAIAQAEKDTNLPIEEREQIIARLKASYQAIEASSEGEKQRKIQIAQLEEQSAQAASNKLTRQEEYNLAILKAKLAFDTVGEAGLNAQNQIDSALDAIEQKIIQIQKQAAEGLIGSQAAATSIANLKKIKAEMEGLAPKVVEQQKWAASETGKFWDSIGNTIADSLGNGIDGLIKGTKKLKDVVNDFYSSITSAVVKYLAKEALIKVFGLGNDSTAGLGAKIGGLFGGGPSSGGGGLLSGLFGGGSGGGGLFSGLFGGGGSSLVDLGGGALGFASGGSFTVGGTGGTDSIPVGFWATPGETVSVETPNQTARGGSSGGDTHVYIQALDARSVRDLFMEHADVLFPAMNSRVRLNRGR